MVQLQCQLPTGYVQGSFSAERGYCMETKVQPHGTQEIKVHQPEAITC